ncbi:MAG: electron transfer flavoprotein subunit alpha/FixB family protein, partial [Flavobacteriales bacterium]
MSVLVFAGVSDGKPVKNAYESINYGSAIAASTNNETIVVTYGGVDSSFLEKLGEYGADKVLNHNVESPDAKMLTNLVSTAAESVNAEIIIFAHDEFGNAIAPRVSARLNAGHVPAAVALPGTDNGFVVKKNVFSGKAFANYEVHTDKKIISLLPNSHSIEKNDGKSADVEAFEADLGEESVKVKEVKKESGTLSLPEADIVVSGGRGLKGPDNWNIIEEFAEAMGAAT